MEGLVVKWGERRREVTEFAATWRVMIISFVKRVTTKTEFVFRCLRNEVKRYAIAMGCNLA